MSTPGMDERAARQRDWYERIPQQLTATGAQQCEPLRPVQEATNRLHQELQALDHEVEKLQVVLRPVLQPTDECQEKCGNAVCQPPQSPFVAGLHSTANLVFSIRRRIQVLLETIDF